MTDSLLDGDDHVDEIDPNKNYFAELVGEGRKFKTQEDLARGKFESDRMIAFKNKEFDDLRTSYLELLEQNKAGPKLQELLDRLNDQQLTSRETPPSNEDTKSPAMDYKEIESLVSRKIQETEMSRKQEANFNVVKNKLIERFGNNYKNSVKQHMDELGLSDDDVNALARKSPTAFFKTMGLEDKETESFQAPPRNERRSDNFVPKGSEKRNWAYYEKLRKAEPKVYLDSKTQTQMYKDALEFGDAFYT